MEYREQFNIGGRTFGIEDYEDGQPASEHFFAHKDHKRFRLWVGGCGIGQTDTIETARSLIHTYAVSEASAKYHGHQERMIEAQHTLAKLGDDPFNLGTFRSHLTRATT